MKRNLLFLLLAGCMLPASAQIDLQRKVMERMQAKQATNEAKDTSPQVKVEADTDPFTPNKFIGSFRMEVHTFTNGKESKDSPMNMEFWSSAEQTLVKVENKEMKGGEMKMLTDHKNKWTYMLMTDERGGKTGMKMPKQKVTVASDDDGNEPKVTVTRETRQIEGYPCTKVIVTDDEGTTTAWVAKDVTASFADLFGGNAGQRGLAGKTPSAQFEGFPLEFETISANGKDRTTGTMSNLRIGKVDESVFSTDGYQLMELPAGMSLPTGE